MRFSNSYVVAFAFVVCLVCALLVSAMAVALKERQATNELVEQKEENRVFEYFLKRK